MRLGLFGQRGRAIRRLPLSQEIFEHQGLIERSTNALAVSGRRFDQRISDKRERRQAADVHFLERYPAHARRRVLDAPRLKSDLGEPPCQRVSPCSLHRLASALQGQADSQSCTRRELNAPICTNLQQPIHRLIGPGNQDWIVCGGACAPADMPLRRVDVIKRDIGQAISQQVDTRAVRAAGVNQQVCRERPTGLDLQPPSVIGGPQGEGVLAIRKLDPVRDGRFMQRRLKVAQPKERLAALPVDGPPLSSAEARSGIESILTDGGRDLRQLRLGFRRQPVDVRVSRRHVPRPAPLDDRSLAAGPASANRRGQTGHARTDDQDTQRTA